jgi:hypothetical protein
MNCSLRGDCPVKQRKRYYYLRYYDKALRIAKRRAREESVEFKDRYRWRAGIEGSFSSYDARTGIKRLRVRVLKPVRFCATLKAIGVNIFRAAAVQKAIYYEQGFPEGGKFRLYHVIFVFKEHFGTIWGQLRNIFAPFEYNYKSELIMYIWLFTSEPRLTQVEFCWQVSELEGSGDLVFSLGRTLGGFRVCKKFYHS